MEKILTGDLILKPDNNGMIRNKIEIIEKILRLISEDLAIEKIRTIGWQNVDVAACSKRAD